MEMHLWKIRFVEEKLNKLRKNWDDRKTDEVEDKRSFPPKFVKKKVKEEMT